MESINIFYQNHTINYYKLGEGKKIMLAFHGFGQDGKIFSDLSPSFKMKYTIYSVDLFYHGKSHWGLGETELTKEFWREFLEFFFKNLIKINQKISILCFSLGGKFALTTLEIMQNRVKEMYFIAPDGIYNNPWQNIATISLFRKIFLSIVNNPKWFYRLLRTGIKLGFFSKSLGKFVHSQMKDYTKRHQLYLTWILCSKLKLEPKNLVELINSNKIITHFYLGKYDSVIKPAILMKILNKIEKKNMNILDCGHNDLIKHTFNRLK